MQLDYTSLAGLLAAAEQAWHVLDEREHAPKPERKRERRPLADA